MAKANASYETMFIVDLRLGDEAVKGLVEKFTSMIAANGEILETSEETGKWGKKTFAYPIDDAKEGYYVLISFKAPANFIAELERVFHITEGIMRAVTVKTEK